jgi:RNA polymerase sigma-70 factor, ECF subfamily
MPGPARECPATAREAPVRAFAGVSESLCGHRQEFRDPSDEACASGPASGLTMAPSLGTWLRRCAKLGHVPEVPTFMRRTGMLSPGENAGRALATEFSTVDDATLACAASQGEAWAEREIWYRFAPMVYSLLRRMLASRHDMEDFLQEVFVRVFERLRTLQDPAALRSFIYSIALRAINEELRQKSIRSRLTSLFLTPFLRSSVAHDDFESRDTLRRVETVLDQMHPRLRAVFVLRRFEGLELTEIATHLDLSLATVKRDMDKAHDKIAQLIRADDRLRAVLESDVVRKLGEGRR